MPEGAAPSRYNPFARREEHTGQSILLLKITTLISYLLLLVTAFYYNFNTPHEGHHPWRTIWGQNRPTPFALNSIMVSIYWIVLFILQLVYAWSLYSSNTVYVNAAANIGAHYIANNLLLFGFIHLWVRSHFWLAELLLIINFFNLSITYFRHSTTPRLIHIGTVSGPLAWNFVALYWVGARAAFNNRLPERIVGNIFIWGYLAYGTFFLAAFKDYTIGFELSYLSFATAVGQFLTTIPVLQLQWIFAFTIGGLLFLLSLAVASGRSSPFKRGEIVSEDRERAPLLADE
ncbi:DUF1774-domain-containing protein [Aaosphaeria arxii CBS 175.79]|uniref:DUF1774-domain-containing protein n=1 Tax=Aaosphaeria arxii CBS 175.79 TaxID=1450172 RepID=A0A6A5Y2D4_9PLEO|nr:DUF1774-domain-containing protein [Aaosphaeria arxii CBS 175.79]KAF2019207.1 DUF1774-domain-containing protein [Aaosphaeria arxii CBS 175.79]